MPQAQNANGEEQKAVIRISDCEFRIAELSSKEQRAKSRRQTAGDEESRIRDKKSERSLAAQHLLDLTVSAINIDNQIAAAPPNHVFCTVVYSPDGLTV